MGSAAVLLWLFALGAALHAQTGTAWSVPWCKAEMLDARLLLPPNSTQKAASSGLLAVELRNRGQEPCHLVGFRFHFPVQNGDGDRSADGRDASAAAKQFADAEALLAPEERVHEVIAWSTVPQTKDRPAWDGCLSSDGFTATVGTAEPVLKVEHLWLFQCGRTWTSSMRAGSFMAGEEVFDEWLADYGLRRSDLAEPPSFVPSKLRSPDPIYYLPSTFESGYYGWLTLELERPPGSAGACAFQMLRRREADGQTTVTVNHCPAAKAGKADESPRFTDVMLREYGMLPERVGHVDYELSTAAVRDGRPVAATGTVTIEVRDPTDPMLPVIETAFKPCRLDQLALQSVAKIGREVDLRSLKPMSEAPRAGRAYTFANGSDATCLVGGVPQLAVATQPEASGQTIGLGVCRNCSDALFRARGQHWIALAPKASVHFLITSRPTVGVNNQACYAPTWIAFAETAGKVRMPYGPRTCGQIDVSAWREGAYEGDPLNLHLRPVRNAAEPPALPAACVSKVSAESGRPFFFPGEGSVQYGLSSLPSSFHDLAPVALWVSNPTEKEVTLMSCRDYDGFFLGGFDVLDESGNRVLEKKEVDAGHAVLRGLMACTANIPVQIPPHSCRHGNPEKDSRLKLGSLYTLPAGHYEVVPRYVQGASRLTKGLGVDVTP